MAEGRGGCLGSLLQARYTKPFDRLYIVHPVPRIFSFFFFFLLFLVFLTRSRDRVGLRIFVLECKFRFYSMNERS